MGDDAVKKIDKKKAVSWIGRILMLASFVLIGTRILRYDIDFSALASPFTATGLVLAALVFGVSIFLTAFNFRWLIGVLSGVSVPHKLAIPIYCSSNLYKYLPGNIMHFVGRNRLAIEVKALGHAEVAIATVTDNLFLCLAAAIIAAICVFNYSVTYLRQIQIPPYVLAIAGAALLIFTLLAVLFRRKLAKWLKKYIEIIKGFRPAAAVKLLVVSAARLLALTATYFMVLVLMGQTVTPGIVPEIIGLFVLSWVVGFLVPGAPGGLGVREAILIMFLGDTLDQNILVSSVVVHRVVCILGDMAAWGMSAIYAKWKGSRQTDMAA